MDYEDELLEQLAIIEAKEDLHDLDDLAKIVNVYLRNSEEAIQRKAIYPHLERTSDALSSLQALSDRLRACESELKTISDSVPPFLAVSLLTDDNTYMAEFGFLTFYFSVPHKSIPNALDDIDGHMNRLTEKIDQLSSSYEQAYDQIDIEVLPNEDFNRERLYLPQGRLIVPSGNPPRYIVYAIRNRREGGVGDQYIYFDRISIRGHSSLEQAIKDPHDVPINMFGTIAVAKHTEQYSLKETVMPILSQKYREAMKAN